MAGVQFVATMRHGDRFDSWNVGFKLTAEYPWDTPLLETGLTKVARAAPGLEGVGFQLMVVSPFRRCLETAQQLLLHWQGPKPRVVVDPQLSEVQDVKHMHYPCQDSPSCWTALSIYKWRLKLARWQRETLKRANMILGGVEGVTVEVPQGQPWPRVPEAPHESASRYLGAIAHWTEPGNGNVLYVSHGDAVLSLLRRVAPGTQHSTVPTAAYLLCSRQLGNGGQHGPWQPADAAHLVIEP